MTQRASLALPLALLVVAAGSGAGFAQAQVRSRAAFDQADAGTRKAVLAQIAQNELQLPAADKVAIVSAGLDDADREVRKQALTAIASYGAGPRLSAGPTGARAPQAWVGERVLIRDLRPRVLAALDDPDPLVRRDAVVALVSMDSSGRAQEVPLGDQTVADLAAVNARERQGYVRAEIVKAIALLPGDSAQIRGFIVGALDDRDAGARKYALMGAQRLQLPAALPKAAQALSDPDWGVRLAAAGVFAASGPGASAYRARLVEALATETERPVRGVIEAALTKIREN